MENICALRFSGFEQARPVLWLYENPRKAISESWTGLVHALSQPFVLANTISSMPRLLAACTLFIRDNWNSLSDEEKTVIENLLSVIASQRQSRKVFTKRSLVLRMYLLIPSICRGVDFYSRLNESLFQFSDSVVSIIEAWDSMSLELSSALTGKTSSDIFTEDEDKVDLFIGKNSEQCEVINWGAPRGAEIW